MIRSLVISTVYIEQEGRITMPSRLLLCTLQALHVGHRMTAHSISSILLVLLLLYLVNIHGDSMPEAQLPVSRAHCTSAVIGLPPAERGSASLEKFRAWILRVSHRLR